MKKTRLLSLVFFCAAYIWYDESIEYIRFLGIWALCNRDIDMKKEVFTYETTYDVTFNIGQAIFRR